MRTRPRRNYCKKGIMQEVTWSVEFLDEKIRKALDDFPLDIRASFQRIVELIQSHGFERVREPYVKHLEGLGNAHEGQKRNRTRCLRDSHR